MIKNSFWSNYNTLLFDLDGTLIDSAKGLTDTLNSILSDEGVAPIPYDINKPYTGIGSRQMIEAAYDYHKMPLDIEKKTKLRESFLKRYEDFYLDDIKPFAGASDILKELCNEGKSIILATNKPRKYTEPMIEKLRWSNYFLNMVCGDDIPRPKPHPHHLEYAIEITGKEIKESIMVGDSINDYMSAIGCSMDVAIVLFYQTDKSIFPKAKYFIESYYR